MTDQPSSSFAKKRQAYSRLAIILAGGLAGVVVGLAGVYGIATLTRGRRCLQTGRRIGP
jgi:hypothetical protein